MKQALTHHASGSNAPRTGTAQADLAQADRARADLAQEWLEVWHIDLEAMGPALEDLENTHNFLPPGELQSYERSLDIVLPAADRLRNRRRARIALRALLFKHAAPSARGQPFAVDGHGKPALEGGSPAFNMSHSQTKCLIAIGWPGPIGIDLELPRTVQLGPVRQALIISAGLGLGPDTLDSTNRPDGSPEVQFLRAWTRLEALAKAHGDGIGHLLTALGITASGVKELTAAEVRDRSAALIASSGLQIADIALPDASIGAVAAAGHLLADAPVCRLLTIADLDL